MSIPEFFIRRPVMTSLVMLGILLFGIMGYRLLPLSDLPNVDFPTIQVSASLPGASPETMASAVATPLEKQFSTIAGIDNMTSTSALGTTQITIQFALSQDINTATQDVQAAISAAQRQLPSGMPSPPTYSKVNQADAPVLYLSLSSNTLPLSTVDNYAETTMAQRLSMVSGVSQVMVFGAQQHAVRVQLDPSALASRGIGIDDVQTAIANANVNRPTGTLQGRNQTFTIQATGQLTDAAAYRPVIVAYRNGSPVRLAQLGRVIDSVQNDLTAAWQDDTRAIVLAIQRQPGSNTVQVVDAVRQLLPTFRAQIPGGVAMNVLYDRSVSIRASVSDVKFTLLLTIGLVILVIFLFLRNVSATLIPSLALPMSIVGTFAIMYVLGFTLDNLSLMALTLSVGFVVDDAVVMLENIVRHIERGEGVLEAALHGSREIGFTILSMTLSLAAVFIPLLYMGGIVGRLFREFAITVTSAILVSGFVSLTLTPMLCSRFLRPPSAARHGGLYNWTEQGFESLLAVYRRTLEWALAHRRTNLAIFLLSLAGTAYLLVVVPKGFIPSENTGQIIGFTQAAQDVSFDAMVRHQQQAAAIVRQDPNVETFMSSVGGTGANSTGNIGRLNIYLKPLNQRTLSADQVIQELRPKFAKLVGLRVFLQNPPTIPIGGKLAKGLYQYTLTGPDTKTLYQAALQMDAKMRALPGLQSVNSDMQISSPQATVRGAQVEGDLAGRGGDPRQGVQGHELLDRDKASALGVTADQIEGALYDAYGRRQVSTIYTPSNEYWVILELLPKYQQDPTALSMRAGIPGVPAGARPPSWASSCWWAL